MDTSGQRIHKFMTLEETSTNHVAVPEEGLAPCPTSQPVSLYIGEDSAWFNVTACYRLRGAGSGLSPLCCDELPRGGNHWPHLANCPGAKTLPPSIHQETFKWCLPCEVSQDSAQFVLQYPTLTAYTPRAWSAKAGLLMWMSDVRRLNWKASVVRGPKPRTNKGLLGGSKAECEGR